MSAQTHADLLTVLTHAPADAVKAFAEDLLPQLGEINVLLNRTGLVMLPYTDSAQGTVFHLGEILVSEAQVEVAGGHGGYALVVGRDHVQALAVALLDAALRSGIETEKIEAFAQAQQAEQAAADELLLRQVAATRVEMETF
ncbi:MAG: phosphonate C-P lyase system protein PhnG [bacterium]|nr:phosphonate C-P lyase system protein PhnG [bacterium]